MFTVQRHYLVLSLFIHLVHVQNQCDVNENNSLIDGTCPFQDAPPVPSVYVQKDPVALNKNISLVYNSFYHFLMSPYHDMSPYNDTHTPANVTNVTNVINITTTIPFEPSKELKPKTKTNSFNFAAFDSGAAVLSAAEGIKSAKSILLNRKEKYMMMPCDLEDKWFIIQLSEDIVMDRMEIMNLEHYSSNFKAIRIYARNQNDNHNDDTTEDNDINAQNNWFVISDFTLQNKNRNSIEFTVNHWVRSLKIEILSFYGNEYYCTMTQIKVFGSTMLPHWKNELLSHLDEVDKIKSNITKNATNSVNISRGNHPQIGTHMNGEHETHNKKTESKTTNKRQSVFTILTKRITSLELNLTKQQMQVTHLVDLFNEFKDLDQRFNEYQVNLTNHMLYQSYGISMMLKSIKEQNMDSDAEEDNQTRNHPNRSNNTYTDWSSQTSYFDDVQSWKRHETLERIEHYIETLLFMMTNLYWIGLAIVIIQIVTTICIAVYVFGCCGRRKKNHHTRKVNENKRRTQPFTNPSMGNKNRKFVFAKPVRSATSARTPRSQSSSAFIKRKNRKKIKK